MYDDGVARQTEGPDLRALACPACSTVGSLQLKTMLLARPLGSHSLSGSQMKVSARSTICIVCSNPDCDFVKEPSA